MKKFKSNFFLNFAPACFFTALIINHNKIYYVIFGILFVIIGLIISFVRSKSKREDK